MIFTLPQILDALLENVIALQQVCGPYLAALSFFPPQKPRLGRRSISSPAVHTDEAIGLMERGAGNAPPDREKFRGDTDCLAKLTCKQRPHCCHKDPADGP
jgi:hypothetical protein